MKLQPTIPDGNSVPMQPIPNGERQTDENEQIIKSDIWTTDTVIINGLPQTIIFPTDE